MDTAVKEQILLFEKQEDVGITTANLVIKNPSEETVIFKFKSNAADKNALEVQPCFGHIHAGKSADVSVTVNRQKIDFTQREPLTLHVVTAPTPKIELDPKEIWERVQDQDVKVTQVECVFPKPPTPTPPDLEPPQIEPPQPANFAVQDWQYSSCHHHCHPIHQVYCHHVHACNRTAFAPQPTRYMVFDAQQSSNVCDGPQKSDLPNDQTFCGEDKSNFRKESPESSVPAVGYSQLCSCSWSPGCSFAKSLSSDDRPPSYPRHYYVDMSDLLGGQLSTSSTASRALSQGLFVFVIVLAIKLADSFNE